VILAGDIGGTHARFALFSPDGKRVRHDALKSADFPSLEAAIRSFLGARPPKIKAASLGVAGPVEKNRCEATNLPWIIDGRVLSKKLGIPRVCLLNDLVALSLGAIGVPKKKLALLQGDALPKKSGANVAVIAAGTGLGEAALVWDEEHDAFLPLGTEGGHSDFAPRNDLEIDLLQFLRKRLGGRVSNERVLSGPGIGNLYDFFREDQELTEDRALQALLRGAPDRNAAITELGLSGRSECASRTVELFASLYGAEAGNLALKTMATGGVFVAGAIAAHLVPILKSGPFVRAFTDKGRFSPLLAKIPVAVVLDADIGLAGSAYHALHTG
jgi:glucokinase